MTRPLPESTYREALEHIRSRAPRLSAPNTQPGLLRCYHCGHAWNTSEGEAEHHSEHCAYVIAGAALATLQGLSPAQASLTDEERYELWSQHWDGTDSVPNALFDAILARAAIQAALPAGPDATLPALSQERGASLLRCTACTASGWYWDTYPVDDSDLEAETEILAAIASLRAALSAELEKTK